MGQDRNDLSDTRASSIVVDENERAEVYVRMVQHIYSMIHKQTAEMSAFFQDPFQFNLEDIISLHERIFATMNSYNLKSHSTKIKIYYEKNVNESVESIEDFRLKSSGRNLCVENINIIYNFMISPSNEEIMRKMNASDSEIMQNYKLNIRISSRTAIKERLQSESPDVMPSSIFRVFYDPSLSVRINYVDYTISRSLMANIEDWAKSLSKSENSVFLEKIRDHFDGAATIFIYGASLFYIYQIFKSMSGLIEDDPDMSVLYFSITLTFVGFYYIIKTFRFIARKIDSVMFNIFQDGIIILNKADQILLEKYKSKKNKGLLKMIGYAVCAVSINISSSFTYDLLKYLKIFHKIFE